MRGDNDVRNGLALHNERASLQFLCLYDLDFSFQGEWRGVKISSTISRNKKRLQRVQRFQGVTLPGVENMISCPARAHTRFFLSLHLSKQSVFRPRPRHGHAPLLLSAPPNSRQRFFLRRRRRFFILTSISEEIIDHPK